MLRVIYDVINDFVAEPKRGETKDDHEFRVRVPSAAFRVPQARWIQVLGALRDVPRGVISELEYHNFYQSKSINPPSVGYRRKRSVEFCLGTITDHTLLFQHVMRSTR